MPHSPLFGYKNFLENLYFSSSLNSLNAKKLPSYRNQSTVCRANQLTGFYMMKTLTFNELRSESTLGFFPRNGKIPNLPEARKYFPSEGWENFSKERGKYFFYLYYLFFLFIIYFTLTITEFNCIQ